MCIRDSAYGKFHGRDIIRDIGQADIQGQMCIRDSITLRNIAYTGTRATPSWIRGRNDAQSIDGVTIGNFTVNGTPVTDGSGPHLERCV